MSNSTLKKLKLYRTLTIILILVTIVLSFALTPYVFKTKKAGKKGFVTQSEHQELANELNVAKELLSIDQELLINSNYKEIVPRLEALKDKANNTMLNEAITRRLSDAKTQIRTTTNTEMSVIELQTELSSKSNALDSLITLSDSLNFNLKRFEMRAKRKTDSLILLAKKKESQLLRKETVKVISFKNNNGNLIHYLGETQNDVANGNGVGIWNTGSIYRGEWSNNLRHGIGEFTWSDGQKYKGEFVQDVRTGNGTYYWPSGEKYEGEFENNKRHGNGIFYDPDGNVKFDGEWKNDKYVGS